VLLSTFLFLALTPDLRPQERPLPSYESLYVRYDYKKYKIDKIREKTQSLVKENENKKNFINFRVDNMFEKVETQYIELQKKKV
jgi:allophanate hydrolase subunit 1